MKLLLFLHHNRTLRILGWIGLFFLALACITFPVILLSRFYLVEVTMGQQACIIVVTSWICQVGRLEPLRDLWAHLRSLS